MCTTRQQAGSDCLMNTTNEQGHSSVFLQHLDQVAEVILRHFEGKSILEIGCGKGLFLNRLRMRGFSVIGIDPAYEGDAPYILKKHFSASLGVRGDAVILRHVLEHIPDPLNFLAAVREANGGKGFVYIEVPCLDWIAEHRPGSISIMNTSTTSALPISSPVRDREAKPGRFFGGQYFYVVADLSPLCILHPRKDMVFSSAGRFSRRFGPKRWPQLKQQG